MSLLPQHTKIAVLASHKVGHAMQCEGVAQALCVAVGVAVGGDRGAAFDTRPIRPRWLYRLLAPWGPPDPKDRSILSPPWPDIAIASGRETVPYLRAIKKRSGGRTFTVYLGDPRVSHARFDLIALPEHDAHRGPNVVAYLTPPHPRGEAARRLAAQEPDPRVAALKSPRIAMLIGGPSGAYAYSQRDADVLGDAVNTVLASGAGLMITFSRRTPDALRAYVRNLARAHADGHSLFIWDGEGPNPYPSMLAMADGFIVTADSVSMLAETVATGRPVHLHEPKGDAGKFRGLIAKLMERDAVRQWTGRLENWTYEPIDSTPLIAEEIVRRYEAFCTRLARQ